MEQVGSDWVGFYEKEELDLPGRNYIQKQQLMTSFCTDCWGKSPNPFRSSTRHVTCN